MTAVQMQEALRALAQPAQAKGAAGEVASVIAIWARSSLDVSEGLSPRVALHAMPQSPTACAHQLFAQLRSFDAQGVTQIWVETPPLTPAWEGVRDRLTRAATPAR
jgi:L-threonylcarbamoyladenylate synthase